MNASRKRSASRRPRGVGLDEPDAVRHRRSGRPRAGSGPGDHRRVVVHPGDRPAGRGERDRQAPRADPELQDRTVRPGRQGEVEVEVARVVEQVDVVQPGERLGSGGGRLGLKGHRFGA